MLPRIRLAGSEDPAATTEGVSDVAPGSSDPGGRNHRLGPVATVLKKICAILIAAGGAVWSGDVLSAEHVFSSHDGHWRIERANG